VKAPEVILNEGGPKAYAAAQLEDACNVLWSQVRKANRKAVLLYVHGRAAGGFGNDREPHESFIKDKVIDEFEREHRAAVAMLHWPHKALGTAYPEDAARAAGPLLTNLARAATATRPHDLTAVPMVVITHSMGGIVLEEGVKQDAAAFDSAKFVVTAASAARLEGSKSWLARLKPKTFVTRNRKDTALSWLSGGPFIGLGTVDSLVGSGLAPQVFYLDVSNQAVGHPHFYAQGATQGGRANLRERFFRKLYSGQEPVISDFERVVTEANVYQLK
jgi:hypothetical protein